MRMIPMKLFPELSHGEPVGLYALGYVRWGRG